MIIFRYIIKQLFSTWLCTSIVLLFVLICSRFAGYLKQAAAGELKASLLLLVMLYRIPGFLEIIMPLALYLSILLIYGKLYAENEMLILEGSGETLHRILFKTFAMSCFVCMFTAVLSLWITPWALQKSEKLINEQRNSKSVELVQAAKFRSIGGYVYFVNEINYQCGSLKNVFVVKKNSNRKNYTLSLFLSKEGHFYSENDSRYVVLKNGYRYDINPGKQATQITKFKNYGVLVESLPVVSKIREDALPTQELLKSNSAEARSELQWRIALILMVPIATLIALPLSKVKPRQGRFFKLVPSVLLYLVFLALLMSLKNEIFTKWSLPISPIYLVEVCFGLLGVILFYGSWLKTKCSQLYHARQNFH